jgi:hypothetical protein
MEEKKKIDQVKQEKENQELQATRRLWHIRSTSVSSRFSSVTTTMEPKISVASPPRKLGHSGCPGIILSEQEQTNIR